MTLSDGVITAQTCNVTLWRFLISSG